MSQQLFYLAMGGLDAAMARTTATANNLANRNTIGFRAQRPVFEALPVFNQGLPDRVIAAARQDRADFSNGPLQQTGRGLDVAINGDGWIAVQAPDGSPALTRNGALSISPQGVLQTSDGHPVLGNGAVPISLPPLQHVTVATDGTISGTLQGQNPSQISTLNRIMLSNPPPTSLQRRGDGLFQAVGVALRPDAGVRLHVGALEGSNTDPVMQMMHMIESSRMYQMQTELLRSVFSIGQGQSTPLTLS